MKRLLCVLLSLVMTCTLFTGCTIEVAETQDAKESSYSIYYLNTAETELKAEAYFPEKETSDFMLQDLMEQIENQISDTEKTQLLPDEVSISSYELQDNLLIIDFNRRYQKMSRVREILTRMGVVKTFLQVPGVQKVRFTVLGEPLLDSKNKEIGDMTADTFLEYNTSDMGEYCYGTFTLYFTDQTGETLIEEKRNVYYKRTLSKERVVLEQLAKGPMVKGNYPTIPNSVETLDVMTADRICYVDLSSNFLDAALEIAEDIPIYSVVNSLVANCEADKVQISVNGDSDGVFGFGMPLYNFYEKNEDLVLSNEVDMVEANS